MSTSRFLQLQTEAAYSPSLPVSRRTSAQSTSSVQSMASSQASLPSSRRESSSEYTPVSSLNLLNHNLAYQHLAHASPASTDPTTTTMFAERRAQVQVMRCSRCALSAETVTAGAHNALRRVSTSEADAGGMVRFGTNLYYCQPCAKKVGYHR